MRYHQPQGHFRHFATQLRESTQNNQDCQTPSLFRQPILQTARLSQNPDSQKSEVQKSGNKRGLDNTYHPWTRSISSFRPGASLGWWRIRIKEDFMEQARKY